MMFLQMQIELLSDRTEHADHSRLLSVILSDGQVTESLITIYVTGAVNVKY